LAFLMSPMIVLRMKVRRFGEVVIDRSGKSVLRSLVQGLLMAMIERGIAAEQERVGTGVKASRRGASTGLDGHLVPAPDILAPQLGRDLDRPHSLSPADDLAILTGVKASRRGASTGKDGKVVGGREAMWAVKVATESRCRVRSWP
jgi:hypothetical protein